MSKKIVICLLFLIITLTGCSIHKEDSTKKKVVEKDLSFQMDSFLYDDDSHSYYQLGLLYVKRPVLKRYQSLNIYIPEEYLNCKQGDSFYHCSFSDSSKNGYNVSSAPIIMPIHTNSYTALSSSKTFDEDCRSYLNAGYICVKSGFRGLYRKDSISYGVPYSIVDLKAAIRYLRSMENIPGNKNSIITVGDSSGATYSVLLGVSGDSESFKNYLSEIGALPASDKIYASVSYNPKLSYDTLDASYEWEIGRYLSDKFHSDDSFRMALSHDLAIEYGKYINNLSLKNNDSILSLEGDNYVKGSYYDYLLSVLEKSLEEYLNTNFQDLEYKKSYIDSLNDGDSFVSIDEDGHVKIHDLRHFILHCKKVVYSSYFVDSLDRENIENRLFKIEEKSTMHFDSMLYKLLKDNKDKYSTYDDYNDSYLEEFGFDMTVLKNAKKTSIVSLYSAISYINSYYAGYNESGVADYFRIRNGANSHETTLSSTINFVLSLQNLHKNVDYKEVWGESSSRSEATGNVDENVVQYIDQIVKGD